MIATRTVLPPTMLSPTVRPESPVRIIDGPSIAVIIPTYNRATQVTALVERLLGSQSFVDFSVIVVDDGSSDSTLASLGRIDDDRLSVIERPHGGVSARRNDGAASTSADWLIFLDSDDDVDDDWVESFARLMRNDVDIVSLGQRRIESGRTIVRSPDDGGAALGHIEGLWQAGAFSVRRELFDEVGGYEERLDFSENTELALRIAARHSRSPFGVAADPTAHSTVHVRQGRYEAGQQRSTAEFLLETHRDQLKLDPALMADYSAIAGVAARRLGDRRAAITHLARAIRNRPAEPRHVLRLFRSLLP